MQIDKKLLQDIVFSFVAPWAFYGLCAGWAMLTGGFDPFKRKLLLSLTLAFIVFCLTLTGVREFETPRAMWFQSPYLLSGTLLFAAAVPLAVIYLIFRI